MEWYKSDVADEPSVELVWYPRDRDEDSAAKWASDNQFPWPTIKFRSIEKMEDLAKHYKGAVPTYVLVDAENNELARGLGAAKAKLKELKKG